MINIDRASIGYGREIVLENISITIKKGDVVTLVGPNGGGKTTLLKAIIGLVPCQKGCLKKHDDLKIGYVPQSSQISNFNPICAYDMLMMGIDFLKAENNEAKIDEITERLDIKKYLYKNFSELSGGMKQRVLLARALALMPNLLVLDEPVSQIDQGSIDAILNYLIEENKTRNVSIVMSSHLGYTPNGFDTDSNKSAVYKVFDKKIERIK